MQPRQRLTIKEMQVAGLVWEGLTNRQIAHTIGTTEQVVKNYLRNTFDKLGVRSRLELAIYVAGHVSESPPVENYPDLPAIRNWRWDGQATEKGCKSLRRGLGSSIPWSSK